MSTNKSILNPNVLEIFRNMTAEILSGSYKNFASWQSIIHSRSKAGPYYSATECAAVKKIVLNVLALAKENISLFESPDSINPVPTTSSYCNSLVFLGVMHALVKTHIEVNFEKAIECFKKAIALGNSNALSLLGLMYERGRGTPVDYEQAISLYEKAIVLSNHLAITQRAQMHEEGRGGPVDNQKAIDLYQRSKELEDPIAMTYLALMLENGKGISIDETLPQALYQQAAERQNIHGLFDLAVTHAQKAEYADAIMLYKQAILLGDGESTKHLAIIYANGLGTPINYEKSVILFEQAIALGSQDTSNHLSVLYAKHGRNININTLSTLISSSLLCKNASFSDQTITYLKANEKKFRKSISNYIRLHSLTYVIQLLQTPNHPLEQIFKVDTTDQTSLCQELLDQLEQLEDMQKREDFFEQHPHSYFP